MAKMFAVASVRHNLLDRDGCALKIILVGMLYYQLLMVAVCWYARGQRTTLMPMERVGAGASMLVMWTALIVKTIDIVMSRHPTSTTGRDASTKGAQYILMLVHLLSAVTNTLMFLWPMPVVIDPVTGVRQHLTRWVEFTVTAGLMTFVVEAIDASSLGWPVYSAGMQAVSTLGGLLLPLLPNRWLWGLQLAFSMVTYLTIFPRVRIKRRSCAAVPIGSSPDQLERVLRMTVGSNLITSCAVMWSWFVVNYFVVLTTAARAGCDWAHPQWPFILDCAIDVATKLLYAHMISHAHVSVERRFDEQQQRWLRESLEILWEASPDALAVSRVVETHPGGRMRVTTLCSPSLSLILGAEAEEWLAWRLHDMQVGAQDRDSAEGGGSADRQTGRQGA
jgi:hypothetical protein